jgi:hypothetical protein
MSIEEEEEIPTEEIPTDEIKREEIPIDEIKHEEIPTDEIPTNEIKREEIPIDEIEEVLSPDQIEIKEDVVPVNLLLSLQIIEQPMIIEQLSLPVQAESREFDQTPSVSSTRTFNQPSIRVEINGIMNPVPTATVTTPKSRIERSATRTSRSNKSSTSPRKTPLLEQKRYFLN